MITILGIALFLACLIILWLVYTNERLRRDNADLELRCATSFGDGKVVGWKLATDEYRASTPWQDGYQAGYGAALEVIAEMDALRQSGELAQY